MTSLTLDTYSESRRRTIYTHRTTITHRISTAPKPTIHLDMTLPKISNRPSTALPRAESRNKKKSKCGKVTVTSHISALSCQHLPPIVGESIFNSETNSGNKAGDSDDLQRIYEELLNQTMINEALIEEKEKRIEEQIKEMEALFEQAELDRKEIEQVNRRHSDAMKMVSDIEVENTRVRIRESEQALEVANLEESNTEKRQELRGLLDKITDVQNRIERGPGFIKEEIEKFQLEAEELERGNEILEVEVKHKAAELNDVRIELIMKDSDSETESDDEIDEECDGKIPQDLPDTECMVQSLNSTKPSIEHDTHVDTKLSLGNLNDLVVLPAIRSRDIKEKKPNSCQTVLKVHPVLPVINRVNNTCQSTNPTYISRNILHKGTSAANRGTFAANRGTSTASRMAFIPKPPTSGIPAVASRRRRLRRP